MQQRSSRPLLIGLAFIAFISLGLPDGLLGVAWPSIRASFNLSLDALGPLLIMFMIGYITSSFSSGRVLGRIGVGWLLALSGLATATSLLGYALTPVWWIMVALGLLSGLGAGAIDAGLNTYAATEFSPRIMNWLHACFGVGATLGPLVMTSVLASGQPWQRGYLLVGSVQVLLAIGFILTRHRWRVHAEQQTGDTAPVAGASTLGTLRLPITWLSILLFVIYTGIEVTAGQWTYSLLTQSRGVPPATAGVWVSMYWGSLTVGRILFGAIANAVSVDRLLRWCMIAIVVGAALVWINLSPIVTLIGLVLIGLMLAPIFPSLIATTPERLGPAHTANAVGFQVAAASLGASLLPSLVGLLARRFGLEIIGPFMLVVGAIMLSLFIGLVAMGSQRTPDRRPALDTALD